MYRVQYEDPWNLTHEVPGLETLYAVKDKDGKFDIHGRDL